MVHSHDPEAAEQSGHSSLKLPAFARAQSTLKLEGPRTPHGRIAVGAHHKSQRSLAHTKVRMVYPRGFIEGEGMISQLWAGVLCSMIFDLIL